MTTNIDLLIEQFKAALEAERVELEQVEADLKTRKAKVASLEAAWASLSGEGKPKRKIKRNSDGLRAPTGLKGQIVAILEASPTAMDLGSITRAVLGTDDTKSRTRISAAISPIASDPQGAIRRIGVGSYVSRQLVPA